MRIRRSRTFPKTIMWRSTAVPSRSTVRSPQRWKMAAPSASPSTAWPLRSTCGLTAPFVGYGEDGFTPNEFDITEALHDGENVVAVACYEYASASWLEDQDYWRLHGLFRSVELAAQPHVHIEDMRSKRIGIRKPPPVRSTRYSRCAMRRMPPPCRRR